MITTSRRKNKGPRQTPRHGAGTNMDELDRLRKAREAGARGMRMCGKKTSYPSKEAALSMIESIKRRTHHKNLDLRVYHCKLGDHWHITHKDTYVPCQAPTIQDARSTLEAFPNIRSHTFRMMCGHLDYLVSEGRMEPDLRTLAVGYAIAILKTDDPASERDEAISVLDAYEAKHPMTPHKITQFIRDRLGTICAERLTQR